MATPSHTSFRLFVVCLAVLTTPFVSGCELFVHFDRTRIGGADTGVMDSGAGDGGRTDGGPDAGHDGGSDASMDANLPDTNLPDTGADANTNDANTNDANTNDANRPDTGADAGCVDPSLDCPATGDECVVAICSGGGCGTMNLGNSHVLSTGQTPDNCRVVVCNPAGGTQTIPDAADVPASTTCDTVSCTGANVTHMFAGTTTTCATGVCDGAGSCVACNVGSDCPPTGNECVVPTCSSHVCGTMNLGTSHVLSTGQSPGDCQRLVCTGGAPVSQDDPTDTPTSSTLCLVSPACTGTPLAPSFTPATTGTDCTADPGAGIVCGDTTVPAIAGTCVGCNGDPDCSVATPTCNLTSHLCE